MSALSRVFVAVWLALGCLLTACIVSEQADLDGGTVGSCFIEITLPSATEPVVAPVLLEVQASAVITGTLVGTARVSWTVAALDRQETFAVEDLDGFGGRVRVMLGHPGPFRVTAQGMVGGTPCTDSARVFNTRAASARQARYWLRIIPGASQPAVVADEAIEVWGGASYALGDIALRSTALAKGTVTAAGKTGVPAYLRFEPHRRAPDIEVHTGPASAFAAQIDRQTLYDVVVVPREDSTLPVARFPSYSFVVDPDENIFLLPAGKAVHGAVRDAAGLAVTGAGVAVRPADRPAVVVPVDASGQFSVPVDGVSGIALEVVVTPAATSGLPALQAPLAAGLSLGAGGDTFDIRYSAGLVVRTVSPRVLASDGSTPLPLTRVTWIGRPIADAGTITTSAGVPIALAGAARLTQVASSAGDLPAIGLPAGVYDVLVEPPAGAAAVASLLVVDLRAGQPVPGTLVMGASGRVNGQITDQRGVGLASARVEVVPRDLLASSLTASHQATTLLDGSFSLDLVASGRYNLVVTGPDDRHGRRQIAVTAPASGQTMALAAISLPDTLRYLGHVVMSGSGKSVAGATVHLLCFDCSGLDPSLPVAETAADRFGFFTLAVPDPGVSTPIVAPLQPTSCAAASIPDRTGRRVLPRQAGSTARRAGSKN